VPTAFHKCFGNQIVVLQELQHLPHYPSEILSLFLYVGDKRDACNAALNYDLKITGHVVLGDNIFPAYSGRIESLHIPYDDEPNETPLPFTEICEFLGMLDA